VVLGANISWRKLRTLLMSTMERHPSRKTGVKGFALHFEEKLMIA
jgi:hypothetical protein